MRRKLSKSATFKALMKDKRTSPKSSQAPSAKRPVAAKPTKIPAAKSKPTKMPPAKPTAPAETVQEVGGTMTLKTLNRVMLSALLCLEKWSRLLYRQTALSPSRERPQPIVVEKLPATSAHQSAKQVALTLAAITRRLRVVAQRAGKTVQQKLAVGKKSTEAKPAAESDEQKTEPSAKAAAEPGKPKPSKSIVATPKAAKTSKTTKPQQKEAASKTPTAGSKKEKDLTKKEKEKPKNKKVKKKPDKEGPVTPKKQPKKLKKEKEKEKEEKKPEQKETASKTKTAASEKTTAKSPSLKKQKTKDKDKTKPKQKATTATPELETEATGSDDEETAAESPGEHVINRDDMLAELQLQSLALAETLRGIAAKINDALKSGIQSETKLQGENLWIRFMNERIESASDATQEKQARLSR